MAESSTPSGDEQLRLVIALLDEQSNSRKQPDKRDEENQYMVSSSWIYRWLHHVKRFDKAVYPGKLTMVTGDVSEIPELENLSEMDPEYEWSENMWVPETVWCKWVQWYGVDDFHDLDRCRRPSDPRFAEVPISLKSNLGARLAIAPKDFYERENCDYIELQLRRIFGVTHGTETQLWLRGNTPNPTLLDRRKELRYYADPEVRYDTFFFWVAVRGDATLKGLK